MQEEGSESKNGEALRLYGGLSRECPSGYSGSAKTGEHRRAGAGGGQGGKSQP